MTVIIGVDPHKASHTAVAIGDDERELGRKKVRCGSARSCAQLLAWAEPFEQADVGDRVRGRARLFAGPTARRRGRDGRRCAGHVGSAGAGVGDGPVEQERPQRRVVGGDRGAARAGLATGRGGRPQ